LLFATRQLGDDAPLKSLAESSAPAVARWHPLLKTELVVRSGRIDEARSRLKQNWPVSSPPFAIYYRVATFASLGDSYAALDILEANRLALGDDEAYASLKLDALAGAGASRTLRAKLDELLAPRLTAARVTILCAHLIRHPDPEFYSRLFDKVQQERLAFDENTARAWFALLCTAGVVGDASRLHSLVVMLKSEARTQFMALTAIEGFFRGARPGSSVTAYLPAIPLPMEVNYALLTRYRPRFPTEGPLGDKTGK
jgi:hypothetical protein